MANKNQEGKTFKIVGKDISDGYHTFDELYEHRIALFIALCRSITAMQDFHELTTGGKKKPIVWRSEKHSDGTSMKGWFIMGILKSHGEQITYHLPMDRWLACGFAETLDQAPEFDGHTSEDVVRRLNLL